METSIFIAKLMGIIYLVVGLGLILNPKFYKKAFESFTKELATVYLGGLLALVSGIVILLVHNVWTGWPIIITVFGWLAVLKGVWILAFPEAMIKMSQSMFKKMCFSWVGVAAMIFGAIFCYLGFFM